MDLSIQTCLNKAKPMARLFDMLQGLIPVEWQRSFVTGEPSEFPLLPLTSALSLRERENRFPILGEADAFGFARALDSIPPSPPE